MGCSGCERVVASENGYLAIFHHHSAVVQDNLKRINEAGEATGLNVNTYKTMTIVFGQENNIEELMIGSTRIENVTEFVYLRRLIT